MSEQSLSILLKKKFPQIAELPLQEEITQVGTLHTFRAGEVIMDFGAYVRMVPLVVEGSIKVMRESEEGKEILLYFLEPGETCSMSFTCCMLHKKSSIKTIAEEDTTVIGIPIAYMDEWMNKYSSWKKLVMLSYDKRLLDLINVVDSIAFKQMDQRLLEYLNKKAKQSKLISITHQQIAKELNASREAISRLLKHLEKNGKVELGRNQIQIL